MGKACLLSIVSVVALIAWGIHRGSGWIYEQAARVRSTWSASPFLIIDCKDLVFAGFLAFDRQGPVLGQI